MKKGIGIGFISAVAALAIVGSFVPPKAEAQQPGFVVEQAIVSVTNGVGSFTWNGGNPIRILSITSTATGGVLAASIDLGVGGPGVTTFPIGSPSPIVAVTSGSNTANRIVSNLGPAVFLWAKQSLNLNTSASIADHIAFVTYERKE